MPKRTITLIALLCVTIAVAALGLVWSPHASPTHATNAQTSQAVSQAIVDLRNLKHARLDTTEADIDHIIAELSGSATPSPTGSPTPTVTPSPTAAPTATPTSPPTATPSPSPSPSPTPSPTATPTTTRLAYPFTYTLPADTPIADLPSDSACAQTISAHRVTGGDPDAGPVERDAQNAYANQRSPLQGYTLQNGTAIAPYKVNNNTFLTGKLPYWGGVNSPDIEARISGDFTATSTDEIIQWAACKWGIDVNIVRAQVMTESDFFQGVLGDCNAPGQVYPELDPCRGFGLLGLNAGWLPQYAAFTGAWPYALDSTAFDLDYSLAVRRACFAGRQTYLNLAGWGAVGSYAAGDLWGCIGVWFSGSWHNNGADTYAATVQTSYLTKGWFQEYAGRTCPPGNSNGDCLYR